MHYSIRDFAEAIDLASDAEPVRSGEQTYRMANFRPLFEGEF